MTRAENSNRPNFISNKSVAGNSLDCSAFVQDSKISKYDRLAVEIAQVPKLIVSPLNQDPEPALDGYPKRRRLVKHGRERVL